MPALAPLYALIKAPLVEISTWGLLIAIGALGLSTSLPAIAALGWRHVATVSGTTVVILVVATGGADADAVSRRQNASAGSSIVLAAPAWMRARCAAVSGSMRSMKKRAGDELRLHALVGAGRRASPARPSPCAPTCSRARTSPKRCM